MTRPVAVLAACSCLLASARSYAQEPATEPQEPASDDVSDQGVAQSEEQDSAERGWWGPQAGVRVGYAIPGGQAAASVDFKDLPGGPGAGMIPIQIDAGYRLGKYVYAGWYGSVGFLLQTESSPDKKGSCPKGLYCTSQNFRTGLLAQFHIVPAGVVDPWIEVGAGYEVLRTSVVSDVRALKGWELINVAVGLDVKDGKHGSLGPFAGFSMGSFSSYGGADIPNRANHSWVFVGLHGSYWTFD